MTMHGRILEGREYVGLVTMSGQSMSPCCEEFGETMAQADRHFRIDVMTDNLFAQPLPPVTSTSPRDRFRRRASCAVSLRRRRPPTRPIDPDSDCSLSELGLGVPCRMISLTRLMSASTSPVVLTICGSCPILLSRSAATVSIVRRITG